MTSKAMKVNILAAMAALIALAVLGGSGVAAAAPEAALEVRRRCTAQADAHGRALETAQVVCSVKTEGREGPCELAVRNADAAYQALYACNHPEW